jgi:hypothetical protein
MLHTTFRLARQAGACREEYQKVAQALGDPESYGLDRPIPLSVVLEHTSLSSALWALRCVLPEEESERDRIARLFAYAAQTRIFLTYLADTNAVVSVTGE